MGEEKFLTIFSSSILSGRREISNFNHSSHLYHLRGKKQIETLVRFTVLRHRLTKSLRL